PSAEINLDEDSTGTSGRSIGKPSIVPARAKRPPIPRLHGHPGDTPGGSRKADKKRHQGIRGRNVMSMQEVLLDASERGVVFYLRDGRLAYKAKSDALSSDL